MDVSLKNLFTPKNIVVKNLIFENANFNLNQKNFNFFINLLNNDLKVKIDEVYSLLDSYKDKEVDTDLLEIILKTQLLVDEIEKDDDIS